MVSLFIKNLKLQLVPSGLLIVGHGSPLFYFINCILER
jgi:hypothetical protein